MGIPCISILVEQEWGTVAHNSQEMAAAKAGPLGLRTSWQCWCAAGGASADRFDEGRKGSEAEAEVGAARLDVHKGRADCHQNVSGR